ncbi:MAG: L,D-transpeptidase YcbB, partial [Pseudomonadota bacterium]|nr:L,D-transpeptidase YcbB [Pseudomonadota bacterium]
MHALSLRAAFAVLALLFAVSASSQVQTEPTAATTAPPQAAAVDPLAEAIRERVDHLRYASEHDGTDHVVRGRRIVLTDIVARYYESQQFQPKWRDPARLDLLVAALADLEDDGLDPADYHIEALQSFRTDLRTAAALQPAEQADLEFLATDAMMLSLYHLYIGKVDPVQLSSQWNFSTRPVSVERGFERLSAALDSGQIRETFERARPQHVWYQRGRQALRTYRALAAAGGWSPISDGPTMKLGLDDPRVPALRYRLTVTGDLAGDLQPPAPPLNLAFDAEIEAAVKRFQERHGLTA